MVAKYDIAHRGLVEQLMINRAKIYRLVHGIFLMMVITIRQLVVETQNHRHRLLLMMVRKQ